MTKEEEEWIRERYWQTFRLHVDSVDQAIKYLIFTNAGGVIATAGFIGTTEIEGQDVWPVLALAFFLVGLIFTGFLLWLRYKRLFLLFEGGRKDSQDCHDGKIDFPELRRNDEERTKPNRLLPRFGILAFVFFIVGSVSAICGLYFKETVGLNELPPNIESSQHQQKQDYEINNRILEQAILDGLPSGETLKTQSTAPEQDSRQEPTLTRPPSDLPWFDVQRFQYHVQTRLPLYHVQFEQVSKQYGLPWKLLAALGYQMSRWDRSATSPTGVRGLMMLTLDTASSLGIENRLDPHKSIEGGARYLAYLMDLVPEHTQTPDRTWIALAAYTVGMGHIKDAQQLARRLNKNPDSWEDLKTVLPLLSQEKYYKTLKYGFAHGDEPVRSVKRVRAYHALLEHSLREVY